MKILSILPKLILGASLAVGVGVAALPLGSAFADNPSSDTTVTVNVPASITISSTESVSMTVQPGHTNTATFNVTVTTNSVKGYTLGLHTTNTNLTNTVGSTTYTIAAGSNISAGSDAWGVKVGTSASTAYTALTASSATFLTQDNYASDAQTTTFTLGVSTIEAKPSGTYTSTIVATAITKSS